MLPQTKGSETNIKLPFSFFFFSLVALILSQTIILFHSTDFINEHFRIPAIWSAAHLFILGWALMVAMGAMYQLVPVAFLTPIWSEKLGFVQFVVLTIGISSFAAFLYFTPQKAFIPGIITLVGILMFLGQMYMTLRKQAKANILTAFIISGLVCLFFTIFFGISLILSWKTGLFTTYYSAIFKSHLLLGLGGWFTLLIFGFSYKMVPMFSLSHGYSMVIAKYVLITYLLGIIVTIVSFFTGQTIFMSMGFFLLLLGFALFTFHVSSIVKKRIKKKLDKPFIFALSGIGFGLLILSIMFFSLFTSTAEFLNGPLLILFLTLWIVLSIIGYLYKIVPFLWWTHKYSKKVGIEKVPALKDLINEKWASVLLPLYIASCFVIFFGMVFHILMVSLFGLFLFAIIIIFISLSILQVILK